MLNSTWAALAVTLALQSTPAPAPAPAVDTAWPDDKPFTHMVQNLGRDLVALPSLESALILGVGGLGAVVAHPNDDNVAQWAAKSTSSLANFGRVFGDGWFHGSVAVVAYATGRINHDVKTTHVASDLVRAQVLNAVLTRTVKSAVNRRRPSGGGHSFPSGHTSATFASAAVLDAHFGWKVGLPGYAVSGLVGWNRIRDRSHWVSDAIFGAAVGIASGRTVTHGHRGRTWVITPVATRSSVAMYVTRAPRPR